MNFYFFDFRSAEWVPLAFDDTYDYKEQSKKLILNFQNDNSLPFVMNNDSHAFIDKLNNDKYQRFKKIFLYLRLRDSLTQDFLLTTFNFQKTDDAHVVRYQCKNFPFILDCVYDEQANLTNAAILSYSDSTVYFFNPKIFPALISMFVFDDVYGIDFFYDVDVSFLNRKSLQIIDKEIVTLLKVNESKISSICHLNDAVKKSFDEIIIKFNPRIVDKFNASILSINTSSFLKRNFSYIFFLFSLLILLLVVTIKLDLITYIKLLVNNV